MPTAALWGSLDAKRRQLRSCRARNGPAKTLQALRRSRVGWRSAQSNSTQRANYPRAERLFASRKTRDRHG